MREFIEEHRVGIAATLIFHVIAIGAMNVWYFEPSQGIGSEELVDIILDQALAMNLREEAAVAAGKIQGKKASSKLKEFFAKDQSMDLQYLGALGAASGDWP